MTDELERLARKAVDDGREFMHVPPPALLALLEERRVLREAAQRVIEAWGTATFADEILPVVEGLNAALQAEPARAEEGAS